MTTHPPLPDWTPPTSSAPTDDDVTLITGLEGTVDLAEPVTCRYCRRDIVDDADHASDCCWHPGRAAPR